MSEPEIVTERPDRYTRYLNPLAVSVMDVVCKRRITDNAYRSQVARGRMTTTERYAYPYLAWAWANDSPWRRVPVLRTSALACDFPKIPNSPSRGFGVAVRTLCSSANDVERFGQKLALAQGLPVENAINVWRSFLSRLEGGRVGFSWAGMLDVTLNWDHPDPDRRARARRRVLEQFYSSNASPTPANPSASR